MSDLTDKLDNVNWRKTANLVKKLDDLKEVSERTRDTFEVFDRLNSAHGSMDPEDQVRLLADGFELVTDFLPDVPGVSQFLDMYVEAINAIADAIGGLADAIRKHDARGGMVMHPGAWPGGWPMYKFMNELMSASGEIDISDDVMGWVKDHRAAVMWATGADPGVETKTTLGLDFLSADREDMATFKTWFFSHRNTMKRLIYGHAEL